MATEKKGANTFVNLEDSINKTKMITITSNKNLDNIVESISSLSSGSPKGVYADLASLTSAIPTGDTNIYITLDDGHWNYWNGSAWVIGSDSSQVSDLVTLNSEINSFTEQIGLGNFYFKSYLRNSNFSSCEVGEIKVIKSRNQ